jgi:predicted outer membrane protein
VHSTQLRRTALLAALLTTFALPAGASSRFTAADQSFVDKAIALNNQSLERASVVESSADNYVLDYAEQIVGDRQAANTELAALAKTNAYRTKVAVRQAMTAPATARPQGNTNLSNERKLSAAYAPVPYFQREIAANRQAVSLYQAQAGRGGPLQGYARKYLPKMRGELQSAEHLLHVELGLQKHH